MEWQAPKTDWKAEYDENGRYTGDYLEAADYNRIYGNMEYLRQLRSALWPWYDFWGWMPPDMTAASFARAEDFNGLEGLLQQLAASTADPGIGPAHRWEENGPSPTAADLNRIESGVLAIYNLLKQQKIAQPKLAFGLNRKEF